MKNLRIAHIINPIFLPQASDLVVAQPITFESMKVARDFAMGNRYPSQAGGHALGITLYAVQFADEESLPLPSCFICTPGLKRSVQDIAQFQKKRKLPLIKDILDILYEVSGQECADYLIYTNVDIALMPYFYTGVAAFIEQGYDSFVINRRTITDRFTTATQIPLMYAQIGNAHVGYDCFVFKRDAYPGFDLGTICLGTAWIGRSLLANMVANAIQFKEFRDEHLTFHIGDALSWRNQDYNDYFQHNKEEYRRIFEGLENKKGPFEPVWRSYLLDTGERRQFPVFE